MIYHPIILSSIPPGYAREEQGLSRNFRMDPPASPARWDWRLTSTDIPTPNIKYLPTSKSPKPLYDSYWLISSFGYFHYGLISWMAVKLIVVWPTWVFESQQFELSLSVRIQAACSTQIWDSRLGTIWAMTKNPRNQLDTWPISQ